MFRPWVIETGQSGFFLAIAYSLPNFIEAIMGTILITGILSYLRLKLPNHLSDLSDTTLFFTATILTATYVLTQEFKLHNVGGNNSYDFNDVLASIAGLIAVNLILIRFGFVDQP